MRSFAFRTYDLANPRQTATATHHQASKVDKHILASMKGPGTFPGRQLAVWLLLASQCSAFAPVGPSSSFAGGAPAARPLGRSAAPARGGVSSTTELRMGLDLATYLRTEWISAALCTNQTPVEADVCLHGGLVGAKGGADPLGAQVRGQVEAHAQLGGGRNAAAGRGRRSAERPRRRSSPREGRGRADRGEGGTLRSKQKPDGELPAGERSRALHACQYMLVDLTRLMVCCSCSLSRVCQVVSAERERSHRFSSSIHSTR